MNKNKLLILGNGPSLIPALESNHDKLHEYDLMVVNFMGTSPLYTKHKPDLYIMADEVFWSDSLNEETKNKITDLYDTIVAKTDWKLTIYMPHQAKRSELVSRLKSNPLIQIYYFNKTKIEGFSALCNAAYKRQLGMPRAQNVLCAAIMLGIYFGYSKISLAGADNDWIKDTWVNENNEVCFHDKHFYNINNTGQKIMKSKINMAESMLSLYYAFSSYDKISKFASEINCKIQNLNPLSFIDSFSKSPEL